MTGHFKLGPRPEGAALVAADVGHVGGGGGRRGGGPPGRGSPLLRTGLLPVLGGEVAGHVGLGEALLEGGFFGRWVEGGCGGSELIELICFVYKYPNFGLDLDQEHTSVVLI